MKNNRMTGAFLIAFFLGSALGAPSDFNSQSVESNEIEQPGSWERFARMLSSCVSSEEVSTCLAVKAVTAMDRASRMQNLEILPGIQFERDSSDSTRDGKSLESENEITSTLPTKPSERTARLMGLFMETATNFLKSHSLQVKLAPEEIATAARTFNEARGKLKKLLGPILLGVAVKVLAFLAIFGGGLALLVTKALIVSKLALVLASILGLQKLFNGGGSGGSIIPSKGAPQSWSTGGGGSNAGWSTGGSNNGWSNSGATSAAYPYARSIQAEPQEMAYAAQKP